MVTDVATKTNAVRKNLQDNKFSWNESAEKSFQELKNSINEETVLGFYSLDDPIQVIAGASSYGLGAVLVQNNGKESRIITWGHRSFSVREQKFHVTENGTMALVWAVERFHIYLYGRKFDLVTDHSYDHRQNIL